jgi:hypothetical protein
VIILCENKEDHVVRKSSDGKLIFFCPGCQCGHFADDRWSFNGDYVKPTFSPSILVRYTKEITDEEADRIIAGEHIEPIPMVCHSFVKNGEIQFLSDCTHELSGKTVSLEPF